MDISAKWGCVLIADSHPVMMGGLLCLLEGMFEAVVMVAEAEVTAVAVE